MANGGLLGRHNPDVGASGDWQKVPVVRLGCAFVETPQSENQATNWNLALVKALEKTFAPRAAVSHTLLYPQAQLKSR